MAEGLTPDIPEWLREGGTEAGEGFGDTPQESQESAGDVPEEKYPPPGHPYWSTPQATTDMNKRLAEIQAEWQAQQRKEGSGIGGESDPAVPGETPAEAHRRVLKEREEAQGRGLGSQVKLEPGVAPGGATNPSPGMRKRYTPDSVGVVREYGVGGASEIPAGEDPNAPGSTLVEGVRRASHVQKALESIPYERGDTDKGEEEPSTRQRFLNMLKRKLFTSRN